MVNTTCVVSSVSLWPRSMMPTLLWRRLVPVNAGTLRISHTGPLTLGQGWRWSAMSTFFYVHALISSPLRITGSYSVNFCTLYTMRCRASRRKLIYRTVKLFANHHLLPLPPPRDTSVISRLRSSTPLPRPISRTKKFDSFLDVALSKNLSPP